MVDQVKPQASASNPSTQTTETAAQSGVGVGAGAGAASTLVGPAFANAWLSTHPSPPTAATFRALKTLPPPQRDGVIQVLHARFGNRFVAEQLTASDMQPEGDPKATGGDKGPPSAGASIANEVGGKRHAESGWDVIGGSILGPVGGGALVGASVDQIAAHGTQVQKDVMESIRGSFAYAPDVYQAVWKDFQAHYADYIGMTAGFLTVEVVSAMMVASGDPIAEIVGMCLQAVMFALAIKFAIDESEDMVRHAQQWWDLATTASKDPATRATQIQKAGRAFAELTVSAIKVALAMQAGLSMATRGLHAGGGANVRPEEVGHVGDTVTPRDAGPGSPESVTAPKESAPPTHEPGKPLHDGGAVGLPLEVTASDIIKKHGGNVEAAAGELNALKMPQAKMIEVVLDPLAHGRGMKPSFVARDGTLILASLQKPGAIPVGLIDPTGRLDFGSAFLALGHEGASVSEVKTPRGLIPDGAKPIGDAATHDKVEAASDANGKSPSGPPSAEQEKEPGSVVEDKKAPVVVGPSHEVGDANNKVGGTRSAPHGNDEAPENLSAFQRENESADILVENGYRVEQNPVVEGVKRPDYRIEGEIFDNYAPNNNRARNIWTNVEAKVKAGQTSRIVLNLNDSSVDVAALKTQFRDHPIPGLEQVLAIKGKTVFRLP